MRALVFDGELRLESSCPVPRPGEREALVRVRMAGICGTDLEIARGYKGFRGILGHEFVGEVVAAPHRDLLGKRVCGEINIGCGACELCQKGVRNHCDRRTVLGILDRPGAFAEYLTLPIENLRVVPDAVEDERAVFTEPLAAAYEILEQIAIWPGASVAVLGDGRLGNLCAQVLARAGAEVTVFGRHPRKLALLAQLGIATRDAGNLCSCRFDIVVEATGAPSGLGAALGLSRPRGTLILKSTYAGASLIDLSPAVVNELTLVGSRCGPFQPALDALARRVIDVEPMVDAVHQLDQGVEAMERAAAPGTMKVLLKMEPPKPC